jgi:hypothetical protein
MDSHELNNFLHSRGAHTDCPVCGYDGDWVRVQNDHDLDLAVANLPASVRVAALVCENCGFLRLHSTDAIMATRIHHPDEAPTKRPSPAPG